MSLFPKWFARQSVRDTWTLYKHVRRIFSAQRDILSPEAVGALETALKDARKAVDERAGDEVMNRQMKNLEEAARKWLKPYPNAGIRENVEVLLVALGVAMGIRTFFVQPFKIPTGSMQPTLFGVTATPDYGSVILLERLNAEPVAIRKAYDQQMQA